MNGEPPTDFHSVLYERASSEAEREKVEEPDFFRDLNLDQIVNAVTAGREGYNLKPFFHLRLTSLNAIAYRQEVMRDLENEASLESIKSFSSQMHRMREHLAVAEKLSYKHEKERWFLDAVEIYSEAVENLLRELSQCDLRSRGLVGFRTYLKGYVSSGEFKTLSQEAQTLSAELSAIRYCLLINGSSVTVRKYRFRNRLQHGRRGSFRQVQTRRGKGLQGQVSSALDRHKSHRSADT